MNAAQAAVIDRSEENILSIEVRRDGVAVVTIDDAREAENTITMALQAQLLATIVRIEEDASIAAVVITSGKPAGFVAGVSPALLTSIKFSTDAERMASELSHALRKLEGLRKPVVAAVHGRVLGAGFELALACHAIVASDDASLGLPEVNIGVMCAGNGSLRVAARAGLRVAIDLAVGGSRLRTAAARALGLVDDVCPRAILLDAAARHAKALVGHVPQGPHLRSERGDLTTLALEKNLVGRHLLFRKARDRGQRKGAAHLAASLAVDVLERLAHRGFDAAARLEARLFGELVVSETAHRLIELSLATAALDRSAGVDEKVEGRPIRQIAVLGGGLMGGGIAFASATSGISVRLKEKDDVAIGRAMLGVRTLLEERVGRAEMTSLEAQQVFARLSATTDLSGLRNADTVIEALPEDLSLKQEILREVEPLIGPRCVYASNTSSIPIARIAQVALVPERVLGMHYFSPVPSMSLLEVVRADKTAPWAVATAVALGKRQGKTVIVVRDGPGFYTTRILTPLLNEAIQLVSDGVPADVIDAALVDWGFAAGPLERLDDVGIDVSSQVAHALHAAFGARMTPPGALSTLVADDRCGRRNGRGVYRYGAEPRAGKRVVDPSVYAVLGVQPRTRLPTDEVQLRCALALVNEAVRCFGDGILRDPRDGDVGAIYGLGFPSFRGGPFRYVDTIGAADVLRRVQAYADRFGERWRPAPLLVQMAKKGERFFA